MTHLELLQALLPPVAVDPNGAALLAELRGEAGALDAAEAAATFLLRESDPRATSELLTDWERVYGLPESCIAQAGVAQGANDRRLALVAKVTMIGGQTPEFFVALAARLGYTVTITEHRTFTVRSKVNDPLNDAEWPFAFSVHAPLDTVRRFTVRSAVNDPLASWGNELLECVIRRLKPAHTHALFAYQ